MRENRTYSSEGEEGQPFPTPIYAERYIGTQFRNTQ